MRPFNNPSFWLHLLCPLLAIAAVIPVIAGLLHPHLSLGAWRLVGVCIVVSNLVALSMVWRYAHVDGGCGSGLMMLLLSILGIIGVCVFNAGGESFWGKTTGGLSLFTVMGCANAIYDWFHHLPASVARVEQGGVA